jgi:hypothetical protein
MMRFDNLQPGVDGIIQISFFSPGRVDLPGGDPIRGPGLNGMQLVLNPAAAGDPPVIVTQPASANGIAGGRITLRVEATGPSLAYQWLKNGLPIAGATSSTLSLSPLTTNSAGNYVVIVSNPAGRVQSRNAAVGVLANNDLELGLITHLKLDDIDGLPVVVNSAPGGQNGELRGQGFPDTPEHIGTAIVFNGSDNYVLVPNYPKVTRSITVAGWVNPASDVYGPLVNNWIEGRTTGQSGQFLLELVSEAGIPTLRAQIEVGPNRALASGPVDALLGVWHHFAMTANGATLSIYWDGQLVGTADYLGDINRTTEIPWLAIGGALTTPAGDTLGGVPFAGGVDDIGLWNRSLSAAEISGLNACGLMGTSLSDCPPVISSQTNTCPVAANDSAAANGSPVTISVLANDSDAENDPLSVVAVTQGTKGTVTHNGSTVTYTPGAGFCGTDEFTYSVSDGFCESQGRVVVTGPSCGNPPVARITTTELCSGAVTNLIISPNGSNACVVLDGSLSTGAGTLTYAWLADLNGDGTDEALGTGYCSRAACLWASTSSSCRWMTAS